VTTGRGDDGTTGLLYGGDRIAKDDPRTEAYGAVDEAVAALGLARAILVERASAEGLPSGLTGLADLLLRLQRELFVVGAELATNPAASERAEDDRTRVSGAMVEGLDELLIATEASIEMPREFVVPGETSVSAALELARTIVRRAERRAVALSRSDRPPGAPLLAYVNRLADLLWVLARAAERAEARPATPSRVGHRRTAARSRRVGR
jgi:cob(I)alamin adenosyltransferase